MRAANVLEIEYHLKNDPAFSKAYKSFLDRSDRIPMPEGTPARFIIDTKINNLSSLLMFVNTEKGYISFKSLIKEK